MSEAISTEIDGKAVKLYRGGGEDLPVIYTNDYGVQFKQRVTGLYQPSEPCSLYATGRRYLLDTDCYWMPVAEANLELYVSRAAL